MTGDGMILSVAQVNEYIKRLLEGDDVLSMVSVRGEISNLTLHRSGHIYFTLKDGGGVLRAVMFRSSAARLKFSLSEGMNVIVFGRISLYAPSGQYQLYAEEIQPDGVGALYIAYEQIKKRLADEGIFDESRKKPIPKCPLRVGIITSPTGAAIRDMINVMGRRFPLATLILYPALVQGEQAPATLVAGVEYFNASRSADVIIIGRGGGSMEDLWAFNSEKLAYAIFRSEIPIISAVGHETDFTICDFAADLRAPTPSAAAELAVPDAAAIRSLLYRERADIEKSIRLALGERRKRVELLASSRALLSREAMLDEYRMRLNLISDGLDRALQSGYSEKKREFGLLLAKLDAISPLATLARGYAIVQGDGGQVLDSVRGLHTGDEIRISFSDGEATASVEEITDKKEKKDGK